jgi:hypothetical protein
MVTLEKLAAEVIRLESGGSPSMDSELSEAYVILMLRQAANKLLAPIIYNNMNSDDRGTLPLVIASYTVDVQGSHPNRYLDLPEFYQALPFNKGLYGIAPVDNRSKHFIPRHNPGVSYGLPCADLDPGMHSYFTEGLKVYFDDQMSLKKVLVKLLVVAPDNIAKTDSLPIYPEMQADLIQMVRGMLANQPIQDKKLDGNKDIGVKTN